MKMYGAFLCAMMSFSTLAADFSPEEFLGTMVSKDKKAEVQVYKAIVKEATLFEPAEYRYYAAIKFDAGPCMGIYGNEGQVNETGLEFRYNGSWKPVEYLSTGFGGDSDYDGDIYIDSVSFTATKKGNAKPTFELSFDLAHNPDYSDGEDGGVKAFEACMKKTVTKWTMVKKK